MLQKALFHYSYVTASCIALFAFFLVFLGAFLWVYRKGATDTYRYTSSLPLKDDGEGYSHE